MPKFDVVVGNPPYKNNLHLKMLKHISSCLTPSGEIIWLQPARWMQDLLAPIKKNSDFNKYSTLPFIKFELIPAIKASSIFNLLFQYDLIISRLKNNNISILNKDSLFTLKNIPLSFNRFIYDMKYKNFNSVIEHNRIDGIRVKAKDIIINIYGGLRESSDKYAYYSKDEIIIDGKINGMDWTENSQRNQFTKPKGSPIPLSIKFNTINEAENFIKYTKSTIFKFFLYLTKVDIQVNHSYLPIMDDYTKEWTDDQLYEYFKLSNDEIIFVEKIING